MAEAPDDALRAGRVSRRAPTSRWRTAAAPARTRSAALRRGRPRHRPATLELLAEVGSRRLSVDEVAARAGVSKTTIYRRFATKDDLVVAALASLNEPGAAAGPAGERLVRLLDLVRLVGPVHARLGGSSPRCGAHAAPTRGCSLFYDRVIEPRRELLRVVLRDGVGPASCAPTSTSSWRSPDRRAMVYTLTCARPAPVVDAATPLGWWRLAWPALARSRSRQGASSRQRLVIGSRRSRPKAFARDLRCPAGTGGACTPRRRSAAAPARPAPGRSRPRRARRRRGRSRRSRRAASSSTS